MAGDTHVDHGPGTRVPGFALPAICGAAAVLGAGAVAFLALVPGPASTHMALHIAAMNVAAPLVAAAIVGAFGLRVERSGPLWAAAILQMLVLWAAHAPPLQQAAMADLLTRSALHGVLFLVALQFWTLLLGRSAAARWQTILPLLLTGKLACLLGALLTFAPRLLYHAHGVAPAADLADQQLAGLLMVTACPLSYLVAAIVLFTQAMADWGRPMIERSRSLPAPG